tara:strand:+ start:94 stop:297 length:204 start_codon:yes stop_codon:yes gene_type:complete
VTQEEEEEDQELCENQILLNDDHPTDQIINKSTNGTKWKLIGSGYTSFFKETTPEDQCLITSCKLKS